MATTDTWEVIFPYNKHHTEWCPACTSEEATEDDISPMVRRSTDVYECHTCGLLVMAGFDRYRLSQTVILGRVL